MFPSLGTIDLPVSELPSKHKLTKHRKLRAADVTFMEIHTPKAKSRSSISSSVKTQGTPDFRTNPIGAAELMYQQMHRISVRADSRVQHYRQPVDSSVSDKAHSLGDAPGTHSSNMTISNLSNKMKPIPNAYIIEGVEEDPKAVPRHLLEADVSQGPCVRHVKEGTQTLVERSQDVHNASSITAVIKHTDKLIYMLKPPSYSKTPSSAVKVQWRISRYLLTPSFFLVFSMLNRYGHVVALLKRTYNSALCVYETIDQARRALAIHSMHQSSKLLILSWWHPKHTSLTNETTTSRQETTRWLQTLCEGILRDNVLNKNVKDGESRHNLQIGNRRSSLQSQRHMSMVKVEIKRALRRYTDFMHTPDDVMTIAGTLPLISETSGGDDHSDVAESCCRSKLDYLPKPDVMLSASFSRINPKKGGSL